MGNKIYEDAMKKCVQVLTDNIDADEMSDEKLNDLCEICLKVSFNKINTGGLEKLSKLELYFIGLCFDKKMYDIYQEWKDNSDNIYDKSIARVQSTLFNSEQSCKDAKFWYEEDDFEYDHFRLEDFVKQQIQAYKYINKKMGDFNYVRK